ncbi:MAG: hypothetical protein ACI9BW_003736 [Gammaproteobacteria bacterium]
MFVTGYFGVLEMPPDMRNAVRAVYGGFGVAIAVVLYACIDNEAIRSGVLLTVAVAFIGMALGRVVSVAIDRSLGRYPLVYFVVEVCLAGSLLFASANVT